MSTQVVYYVRMTLEPDEYEYSREFSSREEAVEHAVDLQPDAMEVVVIRRTGRSPFCHIDYVWGPFKGGVEG